jgi:hypothetical protein
MMPNGGMRAHPREDTPATRTSDGGPMSPRDVAERPGADASPRWARHEVGASSACMFAPRPRNETRHVTCPYWGRRKCPSPREGLMASRFSAAVAMVTSQANLRPLQRRDVKEKVNDRGERQQLAEVGVPSRLWHMMKNESAK